LIDMHLRLTRFHRVAGAAHAVALSGDGEHLLIGAEQGLRLVDRRGNVKYRLGHHGAAFNAVALSPDLAAGLAMERAGRLFRLKFERSESEPGGGLMRVAAVGIWEQRDDLYSLDFAPAAGEGGLIALGHHALGLTALDACGQLLWRLGPREGLGAPRRTWHAAISGDGQTVYATALGGPDSDRQAEIVAIDAAVGKPVCSIRVPGRVTLLTSLPAPLGVAAVILDNEPDGACYRLVGFDAALQAVAWTLSAPAGTAITALASAPGQSVLIAGTNAGELWRVGAFTGRILARYDLLFASTVLSVAFAESGHIAAGLANGRVAYLESTIED
jgi:hypothetical protein